MSDQPKHRAWICIAWSDKPRQPITKRLTVKEPITEAEALQMWRDKAPRLRNHTATPE